MSQPWISGRFRGVYAGDRAPGVAEADAQRVPVELEYGELHGVASAEPPAEAAAPDELRFGRLRRVKLAPGGEGLPHGERTLFDVRIRDWQLVYPAESSTRVYGTLVGTLSARLAPAPVESEPLPTLPVRAPSSTAALAPVDAGPRAPETDDLDAERPAKPALAVPDLGVDQRAVTTPEQDVARLLGLVVVVLLVGVGLSLAVSCGPATAVLWLSPICAAIALRFLLARMLARSSLTGWLIGAVCWATQVHVVLGPLEMAWQAGCRAPIRDDLLLLAAPVLVAGLVRKPLFVWVAGAIWTVMLVGWCSQLDGTCAATAPTAARSLALPGQTVPGQVGELSALGTAPATDASVPSPSAASALEPAPSGAPQARPARPATSADAATARDAAPAPDTAPARNTAVARGAGERASARADETTTAAAPDRDSPATRPSPVPTGTTEGPGGWITPGDLSPPPGSLRMSLEQANRDPEAFFAATEPRRVYVPTDGIFETGSADLVRGGDIELARLANLLKLHPERAVVIEVHNDAAAGDTQRWLSQRRADAARTWLIHRGHLSARQLHFELRGDAQPLVPADGTYAERRPNRRLELRLADPAP